MSLEGKKALVIDDNRTNLEIMSRHLELIGMRVMTLGKGEYVLRALENAFVEKAPFDICITDIQMPDMDGYEIAKKIRGFKSSISDFQSSIRALPLVALSSMMERDAKICGEVGFDGFLPSPFGGKDSTKCWKELLEKRLAGRKR